MANNNDIKIDIGDDFEEQFLEIYSEMHEKKAEDIKRAETAETEEGPLPEEPGNDSASVNEEEYPVPSDAEEQWIEMVPGRDEEVSDRVKAELSQESIESDDEKNESGNVPKPGKSAGTDDASERIITLINRIIVVAVVTVFLFGIFGLSAEYVIVKGPSESLRNTFVRTMLETRRFGFIPYIFLTDEELAEIKSTSAVRDYSVSTDASLITIQADGEESTEPDDMGLVDEDGDGVIIETIVGKGFEGKLMIVLDPSRVIVGKPRYYGDVGETLDSMCERYDAIGGINAGGFYDATGSGMGGEPAGLTICEGSYYNTGFPRQCFAGFDMDNIFHVGYFNYGDATSLNLRDGVTFGPALIVNGVRADDNALASGINPRTAIGQRADGAVLLLVIDGRQASSIGATYGDTADVLLSYGAVNACNMDGGSSTCMYFEGEYINNCAVNVQRPLPTAFLVRR